MLSVCNCGHDPVCFSTACCPACIEIRGATAALESARVRNQNLLADIALMANQIEELKAHLQAKTEELERINEASLEDPRR